MDGCHLRASNRRRHKTRRIGCLIRFLRWCCHRLADYFRRFSASDFQLTCQPVTCQPVGCQPTGTQPVRQVLSLTLVLLVFLAVVSCTRGCVGSGTANSSSIAQFSWDDAGSKIEQWQELLVVL